jgi:hypothetical protein
MVPKVKRFRGWMGQDFYSAPEVWADSRETCTTPGDGHTLAGTNDDMSRFGAMRRRGVGRSTEGDQKALRPTDRNSIRRIRCSGDRGCAPRYGFLERGKIRRPQCAARTGAAWPAHL